MNETANMDLALVRKILAGNQQAFRTMFDGFYPRLYRWTLARLNGDHEAANEVVQRTFCKGIERLDTYRGEAGLYTWFCQVCRNTLVDYYRTTHRDASYVVSIEDHPDVRMVLESFIAAPAEQPDVRVWQQQMGRLVQATVDSLPSRYGEILEWKYLDGRSVQAIAVELDIGVKAAESLLGRARAAFREAILTLVDTPDALRPPQRN